MNASKRASPKVKRTVHKTKWMKGHRECSIYNMTLKIKTVKVHENGVRCLCWPGWKWHSPAALLLINAVGDIQLTLDLLTQVICGVPVPSITSMTSGLWHPGIRWLLVRICVQMGAPCTSHSSCLQPLQPPSLAQGWRVPCRTGQTYQGRWHPIPVDSRHPIPVDSRTSKGPWWHHLVASHLTLKVFKLAKDYNFNLVLVLITKFQKGY